MITGAVAARLDLLPGEPPGPESKAGRTAPRLARPIQAQLFDARPQGKVIPIARYAPGLEPKPRAKSDSGMRTGAAKPSARKHRSVPEEQGTLDFLLPAPVKPRELGSTVEAVVSCEFPVAMSLHRAVASAMDWSMVMIGYGLFLAVVRAMGCDFALTKTNVLIFGAMFFMIAFTYGLCFALAGADTPGMVWTRLRLCTFDGFPPETRQRLGRFAGACLSRSTILGLLWSLADEECLAWHDHMSGTFPTPREAGTAVFQRA